MERQLLIRCRYQQLQAYGRQAAEERRGLASIFLSFDLSKIKGIADCVLDDPRIRGGTELDVPVCGDARRIGT